MGANSFVIENWMKWSLNVEVEKYAMKSSYLIMQLAFFYHYLCYLWGKGASMLTILQMNAAFRTSSDR